MSAHKPASEMTVREVFAGEAMKGLLAAGPVGGGGWDPSLPWGDDAARLARDAVEVADALIAALARKPRKEMDFHLEPEEMAP